MNDLIGSNFLLLQFPLPLSGEGQGEGHLCGAIAWCATHPNPAACQWHLPPREVVARSRATGEASRVASNSISHLCVILERSEESRCPPSRARASFLTPPVISHNGAPSDTSPVILRERRTESQSDSVGEGSASIAPQELPSNSLSLQFPLPLSGEGQGEGPGVAQLSAAPHIRIPNKVNP